MSFFSSLPHLQLRAKLSMEKVHLALETVGLTAEKTKLEHDCREGASELKSLEVRACTRTHIHTLVHTFLQTPPPLCHCSKDTSVWTRGGCS